MDHLDPAAIVTALRQSEALRERSAHLRGESRALRERARILREEAARASRRARELCGRIASGPWPIP